MLDREEIARTTHTPRSSRIFSERRMGVSQNEMGLNNEHLISMPRVKGRMVQLQHEGTSVDKVERIFIPKYSANTCRNGWGRERVNSH